MSLPWFNQSRERVDVPCSEICDFPGIFGVGPYVRGANHAILVTLMATLAHFYRIIIVKDNPLRQGETDHFTAVSKYER